MADASTDIIPSTLDMLILKALSLEPMHGFGVGQRIEQGSEGVFRVNAGSLFIAFRRLERDGLVKAEWRTSENNRRAKYYALTAKGGRRLRSETRAWERRSGAIARLLEA
jgi:PadR family transcriptional regulator, regulatory protein PadR